MLLLGKLKSIKVDAVFLEQVAEIDAAHKAAVRLGDGIFKKVCCTLADQPLQLIIQRIGTGLHGVERSCIVQQRALFCGQRVPLGQMVGNNLLNACGGSLGVDLTDNSHN